MEQDDGAEYSLAIQGASITRYRALLGCVGWMERSDTHRVDQWVWR